MAISNLEGGSPRDRATGVAVSVAAHAALVAFLVQLPATTPVADVARATLIAPVETYFELPPLPDEPEPAPVMEEEAPASTGSSAPSQAGVQLAEASGGAGGFPDVPPPAGEPSPESPAPTPETPSEAPVAVAVVDSMAQPNANSGLGRIRESDVTGTAGAAGTAPAGHIPGSAGRAKSGGTGNGTGIGTGNGSGPSIIIGGPKRHPKRHPPRGIPGRRGW